jgi:hypothetical protein
VCWVQKKITDTDLGGVRKTFDQSSNHQTSSEFEAVKEGTGESHE